MRFRSHAERAEAEARIRAEYNERTRQDYALPSGPPPPPPRPTRDMEPVRLRERRRSGNNLGRMADVIVLWNWYAERQAEKS